MLVHTQQGCHKIASTTLPPFPDLSPIEHIWDHLGRQAGQPTSLVELQARLQKLWNEMPRDIIRNLHAPNARSYRIVHLH
ncbi:hypothetical protein TNCV_3434511 [Trichonephila clavipes]|nr:hypothetical protein TNCV_3434511 [Trichonephila clavipes]